MSTIYILSLFFPSGTIYLKSVWKKWHWMIFPSNGHVNVLQALYSLLSVIETLLHVKLSAALGSLSCLIGIPKQFSARALNPAAAAAAARAPQERDRTGHLQSSSEPGMTPWALTVCDGGDVLVGTSVSGCCGVAWGARTQPWSCSFCSHYYGARRCADLRASKSVGVTFVSS